MDGFSIEFVITTALASLALIVAAASLLVSIAAHRRIGRSFDQRLIISEKPLIETTAQAIDGAPNWSRVVIKIWNRAPCSLKLIALEIKRPRKAVGALDRAHHRIILDQDKATSEIALDATIERGGDMRHWHDIRGEVRHEQSGVHHIILFVFVPESSLPTRLSIQLSASATEVIARGKVFNVAAQIPLLPSREVFQLPSRVVLQPPIVDAKVHDSNEPSPNGDR